MKKTQNFLLGITGIMVILMICLGLYNVAFAGDWKQCETRIAFLNTKNVKMYYQLLWLDHKVPEYYGRPITRAGGEIGKLTIDIPSKNFRLCPGRHVMIWSTKEKYKVYMFVITSEMKNIALTPDTVKCKEVPEVPFKVLWQKIMKEKLE